MTQTWTVELFVYLITALCALLLLPRSANWRLRLIIGTIGMQALAQSVTQLRVNHPFWHTRLGSIAGVVEMFAGALALTAVYLLRRENVERKSADAKLRLAEAGEKSLTVSPANKRVAPSPPLPDLNHRRQVPLGPAKSILALDSALSSAGSQNSATQRPPYSASHHVKVHSAQRFPVSLRARVTLLDQDKDTFECEIADLSQGGARIRIPVHLQPSSLVRIEVQSLLFLGEVCWCGGAQGQFEAGVRFEHKLDLAHLFQLLRAIGFESTVKPVETRSA